MFNILQNKEYKCYHGKVKVITLCNVNLHFTNIYFFILYRICVLLFCRIVVLSTFIPRLPLLVFSSKEFISVFEHIWRWFLVFYLKRKHIQNEFKWHSSWDMFRIGQHVLVIALLSICFKMSVLIIITVWERNILRSSHKRWFVQKCADKAAKKIWNFYSVPRKKGSKS